MIEFPNRSRSYDRTRHAVRFWGHDSAIEASFFIDEDALRRIQPDARPNESGFLNAFDSNRDLICAAAARVYVRGSRGSYDLVAANFWDEDPGGSRSIGEAVRRAIEQTPVSTIRAPKTSWQPGTRVESAARTLAARTDSLQLHIGLTLGDATVKDNGEVYGEGVDVLAGPKVLADPGGILISSDVYDEVIGKIDAQFEDRGDLRSRNIARVIRVYAVLT
jgi:class 3 adenylate cyclase